MKLLKKNKINKLPKLKNRDKNVYYLLSKMLNRFFNFASKKVKKLKKT